ncbi:MAG TPA: hypothetical protein ENL34_07620 [Chloroflexi bacterium]|nr:hypothetical protein [Chloroflexota bacterium]
MTYYGYPLLIALGFGSGLLLLGLSSWIRSSVLRKLLVAAALTCLPLAWLLHAMTGRMVLSAWSPSSVLDGWIVLAIDRPIFGVVLLTGAVLAAAAWLLVSERGSVVSLAGVLGILLWSVVWLCLASGSVLTLLVTWTVFDAIWFLGQLIDRAEGEKALWAVSVNGATTVLLWALSLFLARRGTSGFWWLMQPSSRMVELLLLAVGMRLGFYPFHVGRAEGPGQSRLLALAGLLQPATGMALLYRILLLPGELTPPTWFLVWGGVSAMWLAIKATGVEASRARYVAGYALFLLAATGATALEDPGSLLLSHSVWLAGMALVTMERPSNAAVYPLRWPTLWGILLLIGAPFSPLSRVVSLPVVEGIWWLWGIAGVTLALAWAAMLTSVRSASPGDGRPPWPHLWFPLIAGVFILILAPCVAAWWGMGVLPIRGYVPLAVWMTGVVAGTLLAGWGRGMLEGVHRAALLIDLLDLQWLYRVLWNGTQNMLSVFRAVGDVMEGSGSVLWSVLILLLIWMVARGFS